LAALSAALMAALSGRMMVALLAESTAEPSAALMVD
jgi:hypothetical protein